MLRIFAHDNVEKSLKIGTEQVHPLRFVYVNTIKQHTASLTVTQVEN